MIDLGVSIGINCSQKGTNIVAMICRNLIGWNLVKKLIL